MPFSLNESTPWSRITSPPSFMVASTTESSKSTFFVCPFLAFERAGYARSIVNEALAECHAVTLKKIDWLLEMEATATFTLNEHYFSDYRQKFLESYRNARAEENRKGEEDLRPEELIARDRFEPALQIMASVRGYFQGGSTQQLFCPLSNRSRLVQSHISASRI